MPRFGGGGVTALTLCLGAPPPAHMCRGGVPHPGQGLALAEGMVEIEVHDFPAALLGALQIPQSLHESTVRSWDPAG